MTVQTLALLLNLVSPGCQLMTFLSLIHTFPSLRDAKTRSSCRIPKFHCHSHKSRHHSVDLFGFLGKQGWECCRGNTLNPGAGGGEERNILASQAEGSPDSEAVLLSGSESKRVTTIIWKYFGPKRGGHGLGRKNMQTSLCSKIRVQLKNNSKNARALTPPKKQSQGF